MQRLYGWHFILLNLPNPVHIVHLEDISMQTHHIAHAQWPPGGRWLLCWTVQLSASGKRRGLCQRAFRDCGVQEALAAGVGGVLKGDGGVYPSFGGRVGLVIPYFLTCTAAGRGTGS